MNKQALVFILILIFSFSYSQKNKENKVLNIEKKDYNILTGSYSNNKIDFVKKEPRIVKLSNFTPNCETDFFTVNISGEIQQWSLNGQNVSGGEVILTSPNLSLSYCGSENFPTFYSTKFIDIIHPTTGIIYYDNAIEDWLDASTEPLLTLNNGGYLNDQYYQGIIDNGLRIIYYFDGVNLTVIDSLSSEESFRVADISVDTNGHAWVFKGDSIEIRVDSLNVYDSEGLISTFDITFNSIDCYGSFFLNGILYVGMGVDAENPYSITPIILNGTSAELGTPIYFPNNSFADMASCQYTETISTEGVILNKVTIYPNPTKGIINLPTNIDIESIKVYNLIGQLIKAPIFSNTIDLTKQPKGIYVIKIITENGEFNKKVIKR